VLEEEEEEEEEERRALQIDGSRKKAAR